MDLRELFQVDESAMGWARFSQAICYCFGALSGGLAFNKYFPKQWVIFIQLIVMGISVALIPQAGQYWVMVLVSSILAYAGGGCDEACNVWSFGESKHDP